MIRPRAPRALARAFERTRRLPPGTEERFTGYGVMAMPFLSGHLLAFRRFVASSIGPAYRSVWLREPGGRWTFFVDVEPARSCPRYFGAAIHRTVVAEIGIEWRTAHELCITVADAGLDWCMRLAATPVTRALNAAGSLLPESLWRAPAMLRALGPAAGHALGAGRIALEGTAPNGQRFRIAPRVAWTIDAGAAVLDGRELGPGRPLARQARLGDFWLPNLGVFAFGHGFFESFVPGRHVVAPSHPHRSAPTAGIAER